MKFQLSMISERILNSFVRVYGNSSFPDDCTCFPFPSAEASTQTPVVSEIREYIFVRLRYVFALNSRSTV